MQELPPAHEALARVLAEHDAVEVGEILVLLALAGARSGELPRVGDRVGDAFRRRRMRRQEVRRARVDAGVLRPQMRVLPHRGEEALGAVGVVAGARRDADADAVGLELLGAGEVGERDLGFGER